MPKFGKQSVKGSGGRMGLIAQKKKQAAKSSSVPRTIKGAKLTPAMIPSKGRSRKSQDLLKGLFGRK